MSEAADDVLKPIPRGTPLVATPARWAACVLALVAAFVGAVEGYVLFVHSPRTLASFGTLIGVTCLVGALLLVALLRAEEARLARELRTARTGTAVVRGIVLRRRQQVPFVGRLLSTRLGTAAVLLADGDRQAALDALAATSPLMQGGRLEKLRAVVDADCERAAGNSAGLERCVQRLRSMERIGNREADLYRLHVLVKALLEQGDAETAYELVSELERSRETTDEERVYVVWLRVWFDDGFASASATATATATATETATAGQAQTAGQAARREAEAGAPPLPALSEGELRLAALLARAHGADKLVEKLEERVGAIARPQPSQ